MVSENTSSSAGDNMPTILVLRFPRVGRLTRSLLINLGFHIDFVVCDALWSSQAVDIDIDL